MLDCFSSSRRLVSVAGRSAALQVKCADRCCCSMLRRSPWQAAGWKTNLGADRHKAYRVAKDRQWWQPLVVAGGVVVGLNVVYLACVRVSSWRQRQRLADPSVQLSEDVERALQERQELAFAAVRMTAHHLLSAATTPFGSPMVVPPANEKAGAELQRLVDGWHAAYPERSVPDIWALVSHKATTSLGGPRVPLSIGRTAADSPLAKRLAVTPARIPEDCLDARRLKRLLADQGLSLEQMVALVGCDRMAARGSKISAAYFSLLLTEQWRPVDAPHGTRVYRCRREVPGAEREQDPCNGVELRGIDMLLLQDPGLKAFVERFSANPRRLHTAIEDVFAKIQDRGHNVNRLKEVY